MVKTSALLALLVIIVWYQAMAGQQPGKPSGRQPPRPTAKHPDQNTNPEIDQAAIVREAIERLNRYSARAEEFKGLATKTATVIRIADILWDLDAAGARNLFLKVYDSLKALLPSEDDKSPESQELRHQLTRLSSSLVTLLARHDASLAKQLKVIGNPSERDAFVKMGAFNNALRVLGVENNPTKAALAAETALGGNLGREVSSLMIFLQELRAKDGEAANRLFMTALQLVRTQASVDLKTLMYLGAYLFTDPRLISSEHPRTTVRWVQIDKTLVINLAGDRPDCSEELVAAYLQTAVEALYNAQPDLGERRYFYALGYQLWPKVERVTPNLMPMLSQAMAYFSQGIPHSADMESAYARLAEPSSDSEIDLASTIDHVEKIGDVRLRDETYLRIASSLFRTGKLEAIRQLVSKMNDLGVGARITNLVKSSEAINAISRGELSDAEAIASKLAPTPETALLWLEIAHARVRQDNKQLGREAINVAVTVSASLDPDVRALILLMASSELAPVDPQAAFSALNEAARRFAANRFYLATWAQLWRPPVDVGRTSRIFPIQRRGLTGDWAASIRELAKVDFQQVEDAVLTLKCEEIAGDFLVALASHVLNEARQAHPKTKAKPESQTQPKD